jgi:hypothetical protein
LGVSAAEGQESKMSSKSLDINQEEEDKRMTAQERARRLLNTRHQQDGDERTKEQERKNRRSNHVGDLSSKVVDDSSTSDVEPNEFSRTESYRTETLEDDQKRSLEEAQERIKEDEGRRRERRANHGDSLSSVVEDRSDVEPNEFSSTESYRTETLEDDQKRSLEEAQERIKEDEGRRRERRANHGDSLSSVVEDSSDVEPKAFSRTPSYEPAPDTLEDERTRSLIEAAHERLKEEESRLRYNRYMARRNVSIGPEDGASTLPTELHHRHRSSPGSSDQEDEPRIAYGVMIDEDKLQADARLLSRSEHGTTSTLRPQRGDQDLDAKNVDNRNAAPIPARSEHGTNGTSAGSRVNPLIQGLEDSLINKSISAPIIIEGDEGKYYMPDPGAECVPAPDVRMPRGGGIPPRGGGIPPRGGGMARYDSIRTAADSYLVSAELVEVKSEEFGGASPHSSRELHDRQAALERKLASQEAKLLEHEEELRRLRAANSPIVDAEIVETESVHKSRLLREERIRQLEEELAESMNSPVPGTELLAKADARSRRSREGGIGKFIGRLKVPFGKGSSHNEKGSSHNEKGSSRNEKGLEDMMESHEDNENDMENTEASNESEDMRGNLMDMQKRSERFIAPEKCPFEGYTISRLKEVARDADVDVSSCFDRSEIVNQLKDAGITPENDKYGLFNIFSGRGLGSTSEHKDDVGMEKRDSLFVPLEKGPFDGFGIAQLKEMAREAQIDVSSCVDRTDIVGQLRDGGVKPKQAPKTMFGGARKGTSSNNKTKETAKKHESPKIDTKKRPAQYVAMEKNAFEGYSVGRLKEISREEGIDVSSCFERSEIVRKLKEAGITKKSGTFGGGDPKRSPRGKTKEVFGGGSSPKRPPRGKAKDGGVSPKRAPRSKAKEVKTKNSYETQKRPADPFDGCSISQLKELAAKSNVSIMSCIDRSEIVTALKRAGVTNRKRFFGRG